MWDYIGCTRKSPSGLGLRKQIPQTEHWCRLSESVPIALNLRGLFWYTQYSPTLLRSWGQHDLCIPSSLNWPRRLFRTKSWRSNRAPKQTIPQMWWLILAISSQQTWDRNKSVEIATKSICVQRHFFVPSVSAEKQNLFEKPFTLKLLSPYIYHKKSNLETT